MSGLWTQLRFYSAAGQSIRPHDVTRDDRAVLEVEGFGQFHVDARAAASGRLQHLVNYAYQKGRADKTREVAAVLELNTEEAPDALE